MTEDVIVWVNPRDIRAIGGFLGQRFEANRARRLKDPLLVEQFIRLHEERNWDDWFWMGEQVGKWLDASAYAALIASDEDLLDQVNQVLERLARSQDEDGYLGITSVHHRDPVRGMQLYGWATTSCAPGGRTPGSSRSPGASRGTGTTAARAR